jgi:hypothetical protein
MAEDGHTMKNTEVMQHMATCFFTKLYTTDPEVRPDEVVQVFQSCISDETNATLCREFSEEEISNALFQIVPLKALGPDGFPARFFKGTGRCLRRMWSQLCGSFLTQSKCQLELMRLQLFCYPRKRT